MATVASFSELWLQRFLAFLLNLLPLTEHELVMSFSITQFGNPVSDMLFFRFRTPKYNSLSLNINFQEIKIVPRYLTEEGSFALSFLIPREASVQGAILGLYHKRICAGVQGSYLVRTVQEDVLAGVAVPVAEGLLSLRSNGSGFLGAHKI